MKSIRNIFRLVRVTFVMARYGALFALKELQLAPALRAVAWVMTIGISARGRPGERLAKALENLGPSFIKLGQALSTRADLVGDDFARDLSSLQDRVPPFPAALARAIIEEELGQPIDVLFKNFDDEPVAAASIAQVHKAKTPEGETVAVKVLRPKIEQIFQRDLEWLLWIAQIAEKRSATMKRLKPVEVMQELAETVRLEMDLRFEAAASSELRENFAGDAGFVVPQVDWKRTARRVMVSEWVSGINIADRKALLKAGHDLDALLKTAAECFFKQIFRDGFFHADMHPGNIFIGKRGELVVVDFGIMGRVKKEARLFLAQTLLAFLNRDYYAVARLHMEYGFVPQTKSVDAFAQACRSIGEPIMGLPVNEISIGKLLGQLFKVAEDFDMQTDPSFFLLHKTLMMAEGIGRMLNPNINMWQLSEPLISQWARENFGVRAKLREKMRDFSVLSAKLEQLLEKAELALDEAIHYLRQKNRAEEPTS